MITFHRKSQDDILLGGVPSPLCVVGWKTPGHYKRILCLWFWGIAVSLPKNRQFVRCFR